MVPNVSATSSKSAHTNKQLKRSGDAEPVMTSNFNSQSEVKQKRKSVNRGTIVSTRKQSEYNPSDYSPSPSLQNVVITSGPVVIQKNEESKEAQRMALLKQKAEERYKRNRSIFINTCNCRYELDTL